MQKKMVWLTCLQACLIVPELHAAVLSLPSCDAMHDPLACKVC